MKHADGTVDDPSVTTRLTDGPRRHHRGRRRPPRTLAADDVKQHVELAYAVTVHGVQGETADTAHLILDENTSAAAAYVGMTGGRTANTVHLVAEDLDDAQSRWVDAAGRGRADLGVNAARQAAEQAAARYATTSNFSNSRPVDPEHLAQILDQLREA